MSAAAQFSTQRLDVGPWHEVAEAVDLDLVGVVRSTLTAATTVALPDQWRGHYDAERAAAFVRERDGESPTLLAIDREAGTAVGLIILFEVGGDLRIGYVVAELRWGQGIASELVAGLVDWAREQPSITSVSGGVEPDNAASIRVLEKCGFERVDEHAEELLFRRPV